MAEHYPTHLQALPGQVLLRLGAHFQSIAYFDNARFCLEIAHEKEGSWQVKTLLPFGEAFHGWATTTARGRPTRKSRRAIPR